MTVRLDLKLGSLADGDRLPDSPDTVLSVQPTLGSTLRTKGSLFVLATGPAGRKYREYTRLVAEKIRDEYYYDLSAGIVVCLQKAIRSANKRLSQVADKLGHKQGEPGPVGLAIVVIRAQELYVVTIGPAEAYLLRQASLLTLPDADLAAGLPNESGNDAAVWHGEIVPGDCLALLSPGVTARLGLASIQESVQRLHPQLAVEQFRRNLIGAPPQAAAGNAPAAVASPPTADGMLIVEAVEAATDHRLQPLKPVWPNDTAGSGIKERSGLPIVDSVGEGMAHVADSAKELQQHAGNLARGAVYGLFDRMPHRRAVPGRVLPPTARVEGRRRLAYAVIGLLLVFAIVGTTVAVLANGKQDQQLGRGYNGSQAYQQIVSNLDRVFGDNRDLLTTDPDEAGKLLKESYQLLTVAKQNGVSDQSLATPKAQIVAGLNRYYHVLTVNPKIIMAFDRDDLATVVRGPDGCAYVLDKTTDTMYRVDLAAKKRMPIMFKGMTISGGQVSRPLILATAAQDVLVLDDHNALWKWRPAINDTTGKGTPLRVRIDDSVNWGGEIRGLGTYVTNPGLGLYSLYIVDPTAQQVLRYVASKDGSGYRGAAENYMVTPYDVSNVNDIFIDGSLYLSVKGKVARFDSGLEIKNWSLKQAPDTILRPQAPNYTRITSDSLSQNDGRMYAYDSLNHRVIAFRKDTGAYIEQYIVPLSSGQMSALTGMFIVPGTNGAPASLYWVDSGNLLGAKLVDTAPPNGLSPKPTASKTPVPSASSSATAH